MRREILSVIHTPDAPRAIAAYSQGILIQRGSRHREVVTSGQVALDPQTGKLIKGDIVSQTERVLESVGAILKAGGANPGDIYKTDIVITDAENFAPFNQAYQAWNWVNGQSTLPTRFTSVGGLLIPGALVEVRASAAYSAPKRTIIDLKSLRRG